MFTSGEFKGIYYTIFKVANYLLHVVHFKRNFLAIIAEYTYTVYI